MKLSTLKEIMNTYLKEADEDNNMNPIFKKEVIPEIKKLSSFLFAWGD
jgi:hypothetical protein